MKTLIFITTTSLFINVHANCNLISNNDLLDKVDDWVVGQLPQNDPCFNIENWNVRFVSVSNVRLLITPLFWLRTFDTLNLNSFKITDRTNSRSFANVL